MKLPNTYFSTRLSGSVRETELRIRNIFQGQKKRPPVWLMALAALSILLCGSLVSCQEQEGPPSSPVGSAASVLPEDSGASFASSSSTVELPVVLDLPSRFETQETGAPLEGLTVSDLPMVPADLTALDQSEHWNETVWLLSQDVEHDIALYGVLQFDDYTPMLARADRMYGVILRHGDNWRLYPLDWNVNLWAYQAPELYVSDFDGDGQDEAAFSLAWGRGASSLWQESFYICQLDTLEYTTPDFHGDLSLTAQYDTSAYQLTVSTNAQQITLDETWVAEACLEQGDLRAETTVHFLFREGQPWCQLWFWPSRAPMSDPILVDYPIVFQDGEYRLGEPQISLEDYSLYYLAPQLVSFRWISEQGQVMQAASLTEYEAGGQPVSRSRDIDTPYVYPLTVDDPAWADYSALQKREMLEIPTDILPRLTTPALVETVVNYPYLPDIYAFDSLAMGFSSLERFNGFSELIAREDAAECLEDYLERSRSELDEMDPWYLAAGALLDYLTGNG